MNRREALLAVLAAPIVGATVKAETWPEVLTMENTEGLRPLVIRDANGCVVKGCVTANRTTGECVRHKRTPEGRLMANGRCLIRESFSVPAPLTVSRK